ETPWVQGSLSRPGEGEVRVLSHLTSQVNPKIPSPTNVYIQLNSIQFYLYRAITIQLSLGALQSPEPETPLVQAQWQHGQEKTPCYSGRNLKRTHGKIGRAHV